MRIHLSSSVPVTRLLRASLIAGLLGLAACKGGSQGSQGERGEPGPRGEQGPQGERGPQGEPGTQGAAGPQGPGALMVTTPEGPGQNCPHGGVLLQAAVDRDNDGQVDVGEVDPSSSRYLCNGADGAPGDRGPAGVQGPRGEPGALALYGDGSAGDFTHFSTSPTRSLAIGYGTLPNGANLMFRNVRIDGTLIVASGTTIRATGNIIIGPVGTLAVNPEQQVQTVNPPQRGIAISAAEDYQGGRGLDLGRSALLTRFDLSGGGGGFRPKHVNTAAAQGGEAGGRLILAAQGNIIIDGNIDIEGNNAQLTTGTQAMAGGGGGGGGVITLVSRGTITLGANGFIRASGGNGANGAASGTAGQVYGGGGGGGGGIVQLLSANPPVISNANNIIVTGGAAGAAGVTGTPATLMSQGGGGGASGGDGGDGTKSLAANGAAEPGNSGDFSITVTPQPELIFY